jgi:hypothetical protein
MSIILCLNGRVKKTHIYDCGKDPLKSEVVTFALGKCEIDCQAGVSQIEMPLAAAFLINCLRTDYVFSHF